MNKLIICLLIFLPYFASAQPGVTPVVERNGKKYYEHLVESGNTLYGLQRTFGVAVDVIVAENPALSSGLKVGQKVYIPVTKESIAKIPTSDYKVQKDETLYGISRKFNTTVDDLMALNPELKESALAKGQTIKIPYQDKMEVVEAPDKQVEVRTTPNPFVTDTITKDDGSIEQVSFTFSDSTIRHIVMAQETLYTISKRFMVSVDRIMEINGLKSATIKQGQILIIPVTKERLERVEVKKVPDSRVDKATGPLVFEPKAKYKIAMLLPLCFDGGESQSGRVSQLAAQFYMGAKMAVDSLEKRGLKAELIIMDTQNDSTHIASILADTSFRSMDLVIGPFYESHLKQLSEYCKENRIRLVCPVAASEEHLENNRLLYLSVPSSEGTMASLARYTLKNNSRDHIVLVKPTLESDMEMYNSFRDAFQSSPFTGQRPVLVESTMDGFKGQIRPGVTTVLIMPTKDKKTAMKFMNSIGSSGSSRLLVYGAKDWENFSEISNMTRNKYKLRYASSNFLDYYTDMAIAINRKHRTMYRTDLSRMAAHGYDVMMHFCTDFFIPGKKKPALVMNGFEMIQAGPEDGYRNNSIFVIQQEDYELFNIDLKKDD